MYDTDKEWDKLHRDEVIVRWCCALAIAFLLALFAWTCSLAVGAPAPLPRPPLAEKDVVGHWFCTWAGVAPSDLHLLPGGVAEERWNGAIYRGTWRLKGHRIEVVTRCERSGNVYRWGWIALSRSKQRLKGDTYEMVKVKVP